MTLEDLLAKFRPKEQTVPTDNSPPPGTMPGGDAMHPQENQFRDNFTSPSPPFRTEPLPPASFAPQHLVAPGYPSQQTQAMPQFPQGFAPQGGLEDRLARMEDKLKLISDKIDLMSERVSVVWEMQRRRSQ